MLHYISDKKNAVVGIIMRLLILTVFLMSLNGFLMGQGQATLVVTGSVHGQLDPCG